MDGHGVGEDACVRTEIGDSVRVGVEVVSIVVSGSGANLIRREGVGALALRYMCMSHEEALLMVEGG